MKMIGIIGGVSWESTALYYKWINEAVRAHLGGLSSAKILLSSLNYEPIVELERQGRWTDVAQVLADTSKVLEEGGLNLLFFVAIHFIR